MNLKGRIEALERQMALSTGVPWDRIYDHVVAIRECMFVDENGATTYVEEPGAKEAFIEERKNWPINQ